MLLRLTYRKLGTYARRYFINYFVLIYFVIYFTHTTHYIIYHSFSVFISMKQSLEGRIQ